MSDEISQVVELEYKGIYYLLKGTKAFIMGMIGGIKAIANWKHEKGIQKAGESSWSKIQEASDGNAMIMEIPVEMFEKTEVNSNGKPISAFDKYMKENGLRYCIMPDFNPYDDYVPVGIVSQDYAIHQAHVKEYMNLRIKNQQESGQHYEAQITEAKQKLANARTPEEKEELEKQIAALMQAKEENKKLLDESEDRMSKGNVIEFEEYMIQGENTHFEKDPKQALAEAEVLTEGESSPVLRDFLPEECMYPIRDKNSIPKSKEFFYSQKAADDSLYTIKREFAEDDHGMVFSTYYVTNAKNAGQVRVFSDKGLSKKEWESQLPDLLKDSGMVPNAPTTAIHTESRLEAYIRGLDTNFSKASEDEAKVADETTAEPSSEEAKEFVESANQEAKQRAAYDRSMYATVSVPATSIMASGDQIISLELAEGLLEGVSIGETKDGQIPVTIKRGQNYMLEHADGSKEKVKGTDAIEMLKGAKEATESLARTKSPTRK